MAFFFSTWDRKYLKMTPFFPKKKDNLNRRNNLKNVYKQDESEFNK